MAVAVTQVSRMRVDKQSIVIVNVALDSSYPTGGEAISANVLGVGSIVAVIPIGTPSGYGAAFDLTNAKLIMYYGDNNNASDGPLIEVPNTTDLSAVTVPLLVIGT